MCIYIYKYIYIYTHTYIYYIHTYICIYVTGDRHTYCPKQQTKETVMQRSQIQGTSLH